MKKRFTMKKLFFILLFSVSLIAPLEAQWCGRPCLRDRYYNSWWVNDNSWYYDYFDINEYSIRAPAVFNLAIDPVIRRRGRSSSR